MSKKTLNLVSLGLIFLVAALVWLGHDTRPIRIGFIADFDSELGVAGRNGTLLAIEEVNAAGGINGRQVELLSQNSRGDKQLAWRGVETLIAEEVHAIVGHMTSEMSYSTHDLLNRSDVIMISPTTATDLLSDQDDNFLRIYPTVATTSAKMAHYVFRRGVERFAILYDQTNYAFSKNWVDSFSRDLAALGGSVEEVVPFNGRSLQSSYLGLVKQVNEASVDGVLIVANPLSTALISQQFAKVSSKAHLYATEWSYSPSLLTYGGGNIQDLTLIQTYLPEAMDPRSVAVKEKLQEKFKQEAWFGSVHAYDATRLLLAALQRNDQGSALKKTLLDFGVFEGVQSPIKVDAMGDADRISFVRKISEGKVLQVAQL